MLKKQVRSAARRVGGVGREGANLLCLDLRTCSTARRFKNATATACRTSRPRHHLIQVSVGSTSRAKQALTLTELQSLWTHTGRESLKLSALRKKPLHVSFIPFH
jgi:hypothetical protein